MNGPTMRRVAVVVSGVAAGLAAWAVFRVAGVDLDLKDSAPSDSVRAADVVFSTVVAGLGAWAIHGLLVRLDKASLWPFVGSTALAISIIGPSWLADGESAVALIAMHLVAGFVLIAGFARADERHFNIDGRHRQDQEHRKLGHHSGI